MKLIFVNPLIPDVKSEIIIKYPDLDYKEWKCTKDCDSDEDICKILDEYLEYNLNCTKLCAGMLVCSITYIKYQNYLSEYYRYILKFNNQLLYNKYIDKLIKRHIGNIIFESNFKPAEPEVKKISKRKNKALPNKFFKTTSHDLFTGKEVYIYNNPKTKEEITSENPDLLEELNKPKKKVKQNKSHGVPMSAMTFSFKIK